MSENKQQTTPSPETLEDEVKLDEQSIQFLMKEYDSLRALFAQAETRLMLLTRKVPIPWMA